MKKALLGMGAAALIAGGSMVAPQQAQATPAWVVPVIVAAGVTGIVVGGIATQSAYAYGPGPTYVEPVAPRGTIAVRTRGPGPGCTIVRQRTVDGFRRVRVCPVD